MSDFKNLAVWQKAHGLALHVHRVAVGIRQSYHFSLRSQMIRASMSIPANIVEGRHQETEKEFGRFLKIALNSGWELEYHLMVAGDVGAIKKADADELQRELIEVRKMLYGLLKKMGHSPKPVLSSPGTPV